MEEQNVSLKGVVGIQNMGNTCYCNSTLQLLRASNDWNIFCITQDFTTQLQYLSDGDPNKLILLAYQDILKALWSAYKPAYVRPVGFISEVRKAVNGTVYESFGFPVPNDSHEYLVYLLDHFHEAIKTDEEHKQIEIPADIDRHQRMQIMAINAWNNFLSKNSSEIVRCFFGMMRKTVVCFNCKNATYQWELFNSIKIPCEGHTIQEWIGKEVNEVTDIEAYRCDNCHGRHPAKKYSHLWKLPSNLFVTIHRFNFNGHKNMTTCPYNGSNLSFTEFYAEESDDVFRFRNFELRAISDHHGTHMGGHYTAQFKHPISQEWWWFDDESTRPMAEPQFSASNYIFLFIADRSS
jgi:ubiquitin carboxyl-terminal hydrolase 2/21